MTLGKNFLSRLESKIAQQLSSQNIGYLLGAGASHLDGEGYPLAGELWERIATRVPDPERSDIKMKLDDGATGIEQALDLLDDNSANEKPHRYLVTEAIAEFFLSITPPLESHQEFVQRLGLRREISVPVFCLNYDCLIELASDVKRIRVVDGFLGAENAFFEPCTFQECIALSYRGRRRLQADWRRGIIHLYKLHGSLGWFLFADEVRRMSSKEITPPGAKRLMVPPQHRKAIDTTAPPYAALWSDFRGRLCHGPNLLNRLVTIGYGFRDEHLNAVLENALARTDFTLLAFAQALSPEVFERWSVKKNVVVVTNAQCSLYSEIGPGHPSLWSFEVLSRRV